MQLADQFARLEELQEKAVELSSQMIEPPLNLHHIGQSALLTFDVLNEGRNEGKMPPALVLRALELDIIMCCRVQVRVEACKRLEFPTALGRRAGAPKVAILEASLFRNMGDERGDSGGVQSVPLVQRDARDDVHGLSNGSYRVSMDAFVNARLQVMGYAGRALEHSFAALHSARDVSVDNRMGAPSNRSLLLALHDNERLSCWHCYF